MIKIDYCSHHAKNADGDLIYRPFGTSSCLFLLILSPMTFYFPNNKTEKAGPGACILYPAGSFQHYEAEKEFFNSYVHFFCDDSILNQYGVQTNTLFYPRQTEEINGIIKSLHRETLSSFKKSDEMIDLLLRQLLILLERNRQETALMSTQGHRYYSELLELRENMLEQCEKNWNITELCHKINIGKSQFYHYYELYFGRTPKEELLQARLLRARYYISNEAITIKQAAYASGFENIYHFNRYFKKQFGCTPTEFKRK
ncbi:AraC family transcriptional regulator [Lachnospiraceae bacterium OttesenSCG-928-D06]|nr:AraC family transcriptional regulator [Lachnospiraceae bacterium OttesenSCG-928-D06]